VPSFARATAERYCPRLSEGREERILNFSRRKTFRSIDASHLLQFASAGKVSKDDKEWVNAVPGRIVLIGGTFEDANDTHDTPGQGFFPTPVYGVDLNAQAIESDLHGGSIKLVPPLLLFLADVIAGTIFVFIFWLLDPHNSKFLFLLGTVLTILFAIVMSWVLFKASLWVSFIPILIGANIHQYFEHAKRVEENKPP